MRKIILCLLLLISMVGCQKENEQDKNVLVEVNSDSYTYLIPFECNNTRNYHSTYNTQYDINDIGAGMEKYSLSHFSCDDYYAQEGQVIDRNILISLLGRESTDNPIGLNPTKGVSIKIDDNNEIIDAVIVTDIFELNFYQKNDTKNIDALTVALVVDPYQTITIDGSSKNYTISDEKLWDYATNAAYKLESYLRTLEKVQDASILMLIYNSASSDATLPGGFIGSCLFEKHTGQFEKISEKWVLIPSTEAKSLDANTYNEFINFKDSLKNYLPENISIIGYGKYVESLLSYLRIEVRVLNKTYAEGKSLVQYCAKLMELFKNNESSLIINIFSNNDIFATIERKKGQNKISIVYIY